MDNKNNIQYYKEMEKRLSLMNVPEWVATINALRNFSKEDGKKYRVKYKEQRQRKDRTFSFDKVEYIEEQHMFIFTRYETDWATGEKTNEVDSRIEIKDIDVISLIIEDEINPEDFMFFN
jgi:hypothetical protein